MQTEEVTFTPEICLYDSRSTPSSYFVALEMEHHHPGHTPGSLTHRENCDFYMSQWRLGCFVLVNKNKQSFKKCSNFLNDIVVTGQGRQMLSEKRVRVKFVTARRMNDAVFFYCADRTILSKAPKANSVPAESRHRYTECMCTYMCLCNALAEWLSLWLYN